MPEEEIIAEQPSVEAPPEAQPSETPALEVQEPVQETPSQPAPSDDRLSRIEKQIADMVERQERDRRELSGELQESFSRVKQSNRDATEARFRELERTYKAKADAYDEAVKLGSMSADDAQKLKQNERDKVEYEKWNPTPQPAQAANPWAAPQADYATWEHECKTALRDFEIDPTDPEHTEFLKLSFRPNPDGSLPIKQMVGEVRKLSRKKDKRLADQTLQVKKEEREQVKVAQQKQAAAQQKAVIVDTNAGTAAPKPPTVEELETKLEKLLDNPEVRDFEKHKAWQKEVNDLEAKIRQLGGAS